MKPHCYVDHVQWLPGPKPGETIRGAGGSVITGLGLLADLAHIRCPRCDQLNDVTYGYCWHCDFEFDSSDVRRASR